MANNLQANSKTSRPSFQSREQATILHVYTSRLENHPGAVKASISDQQAPTLEDRKRLKARQQELSIGLTSNGNGADAAFAIGQMFQSYLTVRLNEQQSADAITAYVAQIRHLPLWAIQTGCQSCIARNNPFPPSAGELRTACEKAVQPLRDEEAEIRKVLDAEIYHSAPKAERERIKAGFQALLTELSQTNSVTPKPKPAFTRPKNGTPTTLSDDALRVHLAKYPPRAAE